MRLHYFQHVDFEDPAAVLDWAHDRGCTVTATRWYAGDAAPSPDAYDLLVIMGGPMSVGDVAGHPWLAAEKDAIRQAVDSRKIILGICLGAQLIADVLGGAVTRNATAEIGWYPVHLTPDGAASAAFGVLPRTFTAFHWHGDTFAIPPGCIHTASSDLCAHQAFEYAGRVFGLQFHIESTTPSVGRLACACADELDDGPGVQSYADIHEGAQHAAGMYPLLERFLDALITTQSGGPTAGDTTKDR